MSSHSEHNSALKKSLSLPWRPLPLFSEPSVGRGREDMCRVKFGLLSRTLIT